MIQVIDLKDLISKNFTKVAPELLRCRLCKGKFISLSQQAVLQHLRDKTHRNNERDALRDAGETEVAVIA